MSMVIRTKDRPSPTSPLVRQIRGEYEEMPCLRLTVAQASRFWNVDRDTCQAILDELVVEGFLVERRSAYTRA